MTADIVERLREIFGVDDEAVAEIERLRATADLLRKDNAALRDVVDPSGEIERLRAEVSLLQGAIAVWGDGWPDTENERLRAALHRLELAYRTNEISGSLWDKEQQLYISLKTFFKALT